MCEDTSFLKTVLKKDDWIKGKYFVKVNKYVNTIVCGSKKRRVIKQFKKINHFYNTLNEIVVYMREKPTIDIPIKYL